MKPYVYTRLPQHETGLDDVRIVYLLPGEFDDEVHILIKVHKLSERPQDLLAKDGWGVVSYCWGSSDRCETIIVEVGSSSEHFRDPNAELQTLSVTKNLKMFLKDFRWKDRRTMIWVDGISIDQGTDEAALQERAWHVKGMHHLYRDAGVMMWMGKEENDSLFAQGFLQGLGSGVTVDWERSKLTTSTGEEMTEHMKQWRNSANTSRVYRAVAALLARPWFRRVWVKQEAVLANKEKSRLVCGKRGIKFEHFRNAIFCIVHLGWKISSPFTDEERVNLGRAWSLCRHYGGIETLMHATRASQVFDSRDRVYGCIGIMNSLGHST
jgi:hypothetical protein